MDGVTIRIKFVCLVGRVTCERGGKEREGKKEGKEKEKKKKNRGLKGGQFRNVL